MNEHALSTRRYRLKRRAEHQKQTRQRIVDATFHLHTTVGPAHSTISAIAEAAGVQRLTVYRHFPTLDALFGACTARSAELNPPPGPDSWRTVHEPDQRLETGLTDTYRYYHDHPGLEPIMRDIEALPIWVREQLADRLRRAIEVLSEGWSQGDSKLRTAAISHALDFYTYRSLVLRQQLSIAQAVALLVRLVRAA